MYSVYIRGQIETCLDRPLSPPRDSVEELGYVLGGPRLPWPVCFSYFFVLHVIYFLLVSFVIFIVIHIFF